PIDCLLLTVDFFKVTALEKLIGFLGRHFGPPRLFLVVAGWILALGVWGMVARNYLPMEHKLRWEIPLELRAPLYAKFDSGWYLSIIEWGYGPPPPVGRPSSHAFFPLYPLTAKVPRDTFGLDGFKAGLVVSYLCFFAALEAAGFRGVRRYLRAALLGAVPIAVVLLWIFGMGYFKHEPGLYFRSLEGWHRGSNLVAGTESFFRGFYDHARLGDLGRD